MQENNFIVTYNALGDLNIVIEDIGIELFDFLDYESTYTIPKAEIEKICKELHCKENDIKTGLIETFGNFLDTDFVAWLEEKKILYTVYNWIA